VSIMSFTKRVPDEFGIIIPKDNGITWIKQGGGMSCLQRELEGVYMPIGEGKINLGWPDWSPEGPNFESKLRRINLKEDVPEEDFESMPAKIQRRGNFDGIEEYRNWVEDSEQYGWFSLYSELYRFTYGIFENLDSDPRVRWGDSDNLWETIKDSFSFKFEVLSYDEYMSLDFEDYPRPESAIRPIRILGSRTDSRGRVQSQWAEDLSGEVVFLLCPNAD